MAWIELSEQYSRPREPEAPSSIDSETPDDIFVRLYVPAALNIARSAVLTQLATISERFGGVNVASKFSAELAEVYDQYIISVLPAGAEPLK